MNRYNLTVTVQKRFIPMALSEQQSEHLLPLPGEITYRSGAAARLAGLPAETLRVWERRYGLSATRRSARGQRLYTAAQVQHLGLLKQLVDQGYPIGQLAPLSTDALRALASSGLAVAGPALKPVDVMVVGVGLACRLGASPQDTMLLHVVGSCTRLDMLADLRPDLRADLLLVEIAEVDEQAISMIAAAVAGLQAAATVVLYRFCSNATIRALRAQGWLVARVPPEIGEVVTCAARRWKAGIFSRPSWRPPRPPRASTRKRGPGSRPRAASWPASVRATWRSCC